MHIIVQDFTSLVYVNVLHKRAEHTSERNTSTPHPSKNTGFTATLPLRWAIYMLVHLVTYLRCLLACSNVMPRLTTAAAANYPSRGSLWLGVAPMVWTPYLLTLPTYSIIVQDFTSLVYAVNALWNPERNSSLLIWLTCARIKSSTWRLYACFNGPKHPMSNG
ncbi:hypothetical protein Dda_4211 [Drechslerella dactyloides]|uniref:Uncharacterized protein n=1 Tax=Drechslerella dactyloides TaxID=74499 RepID=A0AAD6J3N2_DREDA|nr:hypothetical protein Dda_4211 [Drechslerella dactyloides]